MAISHAQSRAESAEILAEMEALRKRAARQAKVAVATAVEIPTVECVILPMGDGQVSMGEHFAGFGDAFFEQGETVTLQTPVAIGLFDMGYVNFEGAKQASEEAREARIEAARARRDAARRAREDAELRDY